MNGKKKLIAGGVVAGSLMFGAAALVVGAGIARAETGDDTAFATCHVLRQDFTGNVTHDGNIALGVAQAVAEHYHVSALQGVRIVNYQVETYCPSLWPELQAIGANARYSDGNIDVAGYATRRGGHK